MHTWDSLELHCTSFCADCLYRHECHDKLIKLVTISCQPVCSQLAGTGWSPLSNVMHMEVSVRSI